MKSAATRVLVPVELMLNALYLIMSHSVVALNNTLEILLLVAHLQ